MADAVLHRFLADERATGRLGQEVALALRPGDVVALEGQLGAGKTTLARGLIRTLAADAHLEVPSPTFTLVQLYAGALPVAHFDLYRLSSPDELDELGLEEALAEGVAVVEWAARAGERLPRDIIRMSLTQCEQGRLATIVSSGPVSGRLIRSLEKRDFLVRSGRAEANRAIFAGDASARAYETATIAGEPTRVLMDSPPLILGPPVRDGKAYAEIAHTARSVAAFVGLDHALLEAGVRVPEILAADLDRGFLLLEHLGSGSFLDGNGKPVPERYAAAAELLAMIHVKQWSARMEAGKGIVHIVPPFDRDAMLIEADLLIEWYWPALIGRAPDDALRQAYRDTWNAVLDRLSAAEISLMLRDFHSPNLLWREDRRGHDRVGVLDFQDALIGPSAYDLASLAMDARVDISPEIERATYSAYVRARVAPFDEAGFGVAYAAMAAQRNSKILGIFVRLKERDNKPQYLQHLPRIHNYLDRALAHPALAELAEFYRQHGLTGGGGL